MTLESPHPDFQKVDVLANGLFVSSLAIFFIKNQPYGETHFHDYSVRNSPLPSRTDSPHAVIFLQPLRLLDNLSVEEIDGTVGVRGIML